MRRQKKRENTDYALGGMLGLFSFFIFGIFSLSIVDHYLLGTESFASVISAVLVDLTNGDRGANGFEGLAVSLVLTTAAQAKADDMATKGYFAHVSPVDGKDSWYWFRQAQYTFLYAGENLAVDFSDSVTVERAWMNSPTHRQNILDGHFTEIGVAVAEGVLEGRPTTFVVQMFGTPAKSDAVGETVPPIQSQTTPSEPTKPALATTVTPLKTPAPKATIDTKTKPTVTSVEALVLGTEAGAITMPQASWWQVLMASPSMMLRYAFYIVAIVVFIVLAYVTELEFHRRHLHHVASATLLLLLMISLCVFANLTFFAPPIIAAL